MAPSAATCHVLAVPNSQWNLCPNIGAAYAFCIFFALTMIAHIVQGILYRKSYTWVIICSALLQVLTYAFRIASIESPASLADFAAWFVIILIAPLWTNAFVYMVMGRMIFNFIPDGKLLGLSARWYGLIFVLLDILTLLIQVSGASQAANTLQNQPGAFESDIHIYMAGVGLQQLFILVFIGCTLRFNQILRRNVALGAPEKQKAITLLYTLYIVLALISLRIIFRLIEYSDGLNSAIPNHEAFQYCLDSLPMLTALVLLNIVHPGRIMPGRESDLPSKKNRRAGIRSKADWTRVPSEAVPTKDGIALMQWSE